jgi:hypothetical protein
MIDDLDAVLIGIGMIALYVWVIGTLIWMLFVVPRMHRRQRDILRRLNIIEQRLTEMRNADSNRTT